MIQINPPKTERNLQVATDYKSGMTLQEVGDKHNISRERVRQLLCNQGLLDRHRITKKPPVVYTNSCSLCKKTFDTTRKKQVYCGRDCLKTSMRNKMRKFSDDQIVNIHKLYYEDEMTGKQIAEIYSVHYSAIYHILQGRTYTK